MIEAKIICDSINPFGNRITTWVLKFPRFILAEFNTHRMLSRNSSSSRAIPIEKIIQQVKDDPAMPEFWGKNQKGMQADEELDSEHLTSSKREWIFARDRAIESAQCLHRHGAHKQIVNRLLEPWMHQTVLCTATDWENFFALRAHEDAQPEFRHLAYLMLNEYNKATPKEVLTGQWHIPFGDNYCDDLTVDEQLKVCTARAARVSYNTFEGDIDYIKDFKLHDQLLENGHLSPFEHCAMAMSYYDRPDRRYGNFTGWQQYRKFFNNENRSDSRIKKCQRTTSTKQQ